MLSAMDKTGKVIIASKDLIIDTQVICPVCRSTVIFKNGPLTRPHFAHKSKVRCQGFSEGESADHLKGKWQLYNYFKSWGRRVVLEPYLKEIKQRPDLLTITADHKPLAIEYQCSRLALTDIVRRTKNYQKVDVEVLWIFGRDYLPSQKLSPSLLFGLYREKIYFLDSKKAALMIKSAIRQEANGQITTDLTQLNLSTNQYLHKKAIPLNKKAINLDHKRQQLQKAQYFKSPAYRRFFQKLYQAGDSLMALPKEIFIDGSKDYFIQSLNIEWKYQLILMVEAVPINQPIQLKQILDALKAKGLRLHSLNLSSADQDKLLVEIIVDFLSLLEQAEVLKQVGSDSWLVKSYPERTSLRGD